MTSKLKPRGEAWFLGHLIDDKRRDWLGPAGWVPGLRKSTAVVCSLSRLEAPARIPCQCQLHPGPGSLRSRIQVLGREVLNGPSWISLQWSGSGSLGQMWKNCFGPCSDIQVSTSGLRWSLTLSQSLCSVHTALSGSHRLIPGTGSQETKGANCNFVKDVQKPKAFGF